MHRRMTIIGASAIAFIPLLLAGTADASATTRLQTQTFDAQATAQLTTSATTFIVADQDVSGTVTLGHDVLNCVLGSTGATCDVAFAQAGGMLYAHLTISDADHTLAGFVTGGTDHFRHARGSLTGRSLSPTDVQITLHYVS